MFSVLGGESAYVSEPQVWEGTTQHVFRKFQRIFSSQDFLLPSI